MYCKKRFSAACQGGRRAPRRYRRVLKTLHEWIFSARRLVDFYSKDFLDLIFNFQLSIFKQLILAGKALQFVPTFREYGAKITASAFFRKGKIFFRLERTEELYDYLLEKELIA